MLSKLSVCNSLHLLALCSSVVALFYKQFLSYSWGKLPRAEPISYTLYNKKSQSKVDTFSFLVCLHHVTGKATALKNGDLWYRALGRRERSWRNSILPWVHGVWEAECPKGRGECHYLTKKKEDQSEEINRCPWHPEMFCWPRTPSWSYYSETTISQPNRPASVFPEVSRDYACALLLPYSTAAFWLRSTCQSLTL